MKYINIVRSFIIKSKTNESIIRCSRTFIVIEYDGRLYYGVNKQIDQERTVQGILEKYISICCKVNISTRFMSRTDTAVSAFVQIVRIDNIDKLVMIRYRTLINRELARGGEKIYIRLVKNTEEDIKRISKTYLYKIALQPNIILENTHFYKRAVDIERLIKVFDKLNDVEIDYYSFCTAVRDNRRPTIMKLIFKVQIINKYELYIYITGRYFLYKQIRNIVGTAIRLSTMNVDIDTALEHIIRARNRNAAYDAAPGHALYLYDYIIEE